MVKSGPACFHLLFLKGCISGCRSLNEMGVKCTVFRNNHSKSIYVITSAIMVWNCLWFILWTYHFLIHPVFTFRGSWCDRLNNNKNIVVCLYCKWCLIIVLTPTLRKRFNEPKLKIFFWMHFGKSAPTHKKEEKTNLALGLYELAYYVRLYIYYLNNCHKGRMTNWDNLSF